MQYAAGTRKDRDAMQKAIGIENTEELFEDIPQAARLTEPLDIPEGMSEQEVAALLAEIASANKTAGHSFVGAGAYQHYVPAAVDQLLLRGEFFTAYTPYQAEVSQGSLQAIYEFQTLICRLTGMDLANASVYDGASAAAEGAVMASIITRRKEILVSETVHPHYRETLATYARGGKLTIRTIPLKDGVTDEEAMRAAISEETAAMVVQSPNFFGIVEDYSPLSEAAHAKGALVIGTVAEITSLGILRPPADFGADIAVGEGQALGNGVAFGGPYVGFMATKLQYMRNIPGRLIGESVDTDGNRAFTLTLQAREQHIRRDRATSNICTSQQLNALAFSIHLALLGPNLASLAELNLQKAAYARDALQRAGFEIPFEDSPHYNEFIVIVPDAKNVHEKLAKEGIVAGLQLATLYPNRADLKDALLICVTELHSRQHIDDLVAKLKEESV